MRGRWRNQCVGAAMLLGSMMVLTGCQQSSEIVQEGEQQDSVLKVQDVEDRQGCPLRELFAYLDEAGEGRPYVYAQIFITLEGPEDGNLEELSEGGSEEPKADDFSEESYDEYRQDIVRIEGAADISWQTFASAEEFQEYFSMQEQENLMAKEEGGYEMAFAYYQYQLPEGTHADDLEHALKERYDREDNPFYAISISKRKDKNAYVFSQSNEREIVVMDNVLYGLEYRGSAEAAEEDAAEEDAAWDLLTAYTTQKQQVKTYDGWVMSEETLYWLDHDERITSLDNPTRVFTEVKGTDTNWEGTLDMDNFGLLKEADYQIRLCEDAPLLQIHFAFAQDTSAEEYEVYLCNGFCAYEDYEMTVVNLDTNEQLQSRKVQMSIEMPDMITFTDLDGDGCLDMQIDEPTHWNGERAVVDEYSWHTYMIWNPQENIFESKSEEEVLMMRAQSQEEMELTEYVVQSGDTLWAISRSFYGTGTRYREIEENNIEVLSGHKYLMPGMVLKISH